MKLIKTSAIALAISALIAGPVLAQGTSADPQMRAQGKGNVQKGGASSGDEEFNAQPGAPGERAGSSTRSKGTVGAGSGAKGSGNGGAAADPGTGSKQRY